MINKAGWIFLIEAQQERVSTAAARLENRMQDKADVRKLPALQNWGFVIIRSQNMIGITVFDHLIPELR